MKLRVTYDRDLGKWVDSFGNVVQILKNERFGDETAWKLVQWASQNPWLEKGFTKRQAVSDENKERSGVKEDSLNRILAFWKMHDLIENVNGDETLYKLTSFWFEEDTEKLHVEDLQSVAPIPEIDPFRIYYKDGSLALSLEIVDKPSRFHFSNEKTNKFFGRVEERLQLENFLEETGNFRWWFIEGAGGEGKSRLAHWLVDFAKNGKDLHPTAEGKGANTTTPFTYFGFVPTASLLKHEHEVSRNAPLTWELIDLHGDALIVIDYVNIQQVEEWGQLVDWLTRNHQRLQHKVRIIFIERVQGGQVLERMLGHRVDINWFNKFRHDEPLYVSELDQAAQRELFRHALVNANKGNLNPSDEEVDKVLTRLEQLDGGKRRALFIQFAAEAYIGENTKLLDWSLNDLLDGPLVRFIDRELRGNGVDEKHINLLVVATLCGGITESEVKQLKLDCLPEEFDPTQCELLCAIQDQFNDLDRFIPKLEPDPLGEYFVLERLGGRNFSQKLRERDETGQVNGNTQKILDSSFQFKPEKVTDWLTRAIEDFPSSERWKSHWTISLMELDLSRRNITSLTFVRVCKSLTSLNLSGCRQLRGPDLVELAKCQALLNLNLSLCRELRGTDLAELANCKSLRNLNLSACDELRGSDLAELANCKLLKVLNLSVRDEHLRQNYSVLANCKSLTTLILNSCENLSGFELAELAKCKSLTTLDLSECDKLKGSALAKLAKCLSLTTLDLRECYDLRGSDLAALANCKSLTTLNLTACYKLRGPDLAEFDLFPSLSLVFGARTFAKGNEIENYNAHRQSQGLHSIDFIA